MASRRTKLVTLAAIASLGAAGYFIYSVFAIQGQGVLAQAPLNNQVQIPPAFVMAVDDSGSMTFHNQFPGADGYACWHQTGRSFFSSAGVLRTSGTSCRYAYSYAGPRIGDTYYGIPPVDNYGFARSSDFNPAYFNPTLRYQPWLDAEGNPFPAPGIPNTRVDPRQTATIPLASWVAETDGRSRFQAYTNMHLPQGTQYRLVGNNCGGLAGGGNQWREVTDSDGHTMSGNCAMYVRYWPATFYLRWTSGTDPWPQMAGTPNVYNATTAPRTRIDDACGTGCHLWRYQIQPNTDAHRNFANWFTFYGNRNRSMIAGMTRSMATVNNMRVGYFTINSHGSYDQPLTNNGERVFMRDMGDGTDRTALYADMIALDANGSTPNRQAVNAAGQQFMRTDDQRGGAPVQLSCQRNALMLFTDGYSNQNGPTVGNVDGTMGVPFQDGHDDTMADIATQFYLDDGGASPIRPDLPAGRVPVSSTCPSTNPKVNCQDNLHVNFYGVTLGGRGNLFDPDDDTQDPYTDTAIYNNWPTRQNDNRSTIDDIWHATVNTRGEYVNARTPADIADAMRRILASVSTGQSPSGSIALTGARIGTGSLSVQPEYAIENDGTDWFSKLTARTLEFNPVTREVEDELAWEASSSLLVQGHAGRRIWVGRNTGAVAFNETNVGVEELCNSPSAGMSRCNPYSSHFGTGTGQIDVTEAQVFQYLRGDPMMEMGNGGKLRDRGSLLGDIINSTPVVSAPTDDYGYRSLSVSSLATSYASYLNTKRTDHQVMVYVGANDGMLHAFEGGLSDGDTDATDGGTERFAYIPQAVLGHMGNLLLPYDPEDGVDQRFQHRYFVDGPITVGDAHYSGGWKSVLVGTTGAGGRSVFALNVTAPANGSAFTSGARLWEINDVNTALHANVRNNIGHVLGKPVIVPFRTAAGTTSFKAIFGNGYNSANGKAVLFVVDIGTGTPAIRMIEAEESSPTAGRNGLGNLVVVDLWGGTGLTSRRRDGFADTVYAADQRGAVWKFDLRNDLPSSTNTLGSIDTPLFTTREHTEDGETWRQPILGGLTAAAGPGGGVMLFFGTGSFSFVNDPVDTRVQSIYGVLDRGVGTTLTRANLLEQTVGTAAGDGSREVSRNTLGSTDRGWYADLPAGERAVGYPRVESGIVFIPTYTPSPGTEGGCSTEGFNSLFGLNALSGAAALSNVRSGAPDGDSFEEGTGAIALDTGGSAPVKDVEVMTTPRIPPLAAGSDPDDLDAALEAQCDMIVQVAGAAPLYLPRACGRQSWRQIQ
ncbi:pilus assembly protein [Luteimonas sp. SJ-92]|uniref:Pilus assembly protein n=1 Tax=Luteimonas salinisoli TaxID=2752307 RepID=A0A853JAS6_9GAMM|nr:PilC/PilY family type IV pilus protein [Luteimonas salinisoli]NZA26303.1 pilus assembly protein [Luteimonas salinisoli]